MMQNRKITLGLLLLVLLISIVGVSMIKNDLNKKYAGRVRAVEFPQGEWLNTAKPFRLADFRGKVLVLDFWTYCCINCMHVLPTLKKLEERFPKEVVVVGVHSAKFENEKITDNIRAAILRYKISHPVINDPEMFLWQEYGVRAWPTLVLIDPEGYVVGAIPGEPEYGSLEKIVMTLIGDHKEAGTLVPHDFSTVLEALKAPDTPLSFPGKIVARTDGSEIFVSDSNHNRIVSFDATGQLRGIIGSGSEGWHDGNFATAGFKQPQGLALDEAKNILYIADTENHLIRRADLKTKNVTTIAGTGEQVHNTNPAGEARQNGLNSPWDLWLKDDELYIAMAGSHQIFLIDLGDDSIHRFAGTGREDIVDGPLALTSFAQPSGLTSDGHTLFVADSEVSAIRAVDLDVNKGMVRTIVGEGLFEFGDRDGIGDAVRLQHALGVTWHDGKLYVADTYNHKIKIIDPKTRRSQSFLGSGKPGKQDGLGAAASFFEPGGLTVVDKKLFITDTNNHAIRVADLETRQVTTLQLQGLNVVPQDSSVKENLVLGKIVLSPTAKTLQLRLTLPAGFKINGLAPHELVAESDVLDFGQKSWRLEFFSNNEAKVPFHLQEGKTRGVAELKLRVYSCSEEAQKICRFHDVRATAEVLVQKEGLSICEWRIDL